MGPSFATVSVWSLTEGPITPYQPGGKIKTSVADRDSWLAGFTDAEGCFTLSLLSNSKGYRLRFIISQKWEVNKIILQHISTIFSVGNVSPHSVAITGNT